MTNFNDFFSFNYFVDEQKLIWIQGAGGNTSLKHEDLLYIKASGTRIRDLRSEKDLAVLNFKSLLEYLQKIRTKKERSAAENLNGSENEKKNSPSPGPSLDFENEYKSAIEKSTLENSPRPSMESAFHALLPQKYVFHLHSLISLGIAEVLAHSTTALHFQFIKWYEEQWQSELGSIEFIPACMPGFELSEQIAQKKGCQIYFLQNHGVVLGFEEPDYLFKYKQFEQEALHILAPTLKTEWEALYGLTAEAILKIHPQYKGGPMKFLLPDLIIMYPRMAKHLQLNATPAENDLKWKKDNLLAEEWSYDLTQQPEDRDALENWVTSQIIQKFWPALPELPKAFQTTIPLLPTEVERQKKMEFPS